MRGDASITEAQFQAAVAAAPYIHPRLASSNLTMEPDNADHWSLHLIAARTIAAELRSERAAHAIEGTAREVTDEPPADLSAPALE
jgi:hypothetical protein